MQRLLLFAVILGGRCSVNMAHGFDIVTMDNDSHVSWVFPIGDWIVFDDKGEIHL
jgi:hypothetical protein